MAHYRIIDVRIWNDAKFRALSDHGKLAFIFTLTHPHLTAIGAMRATIPGLAAEIGWTEKAFAKAFGEALAKALVRHDGRASFVWLPNFLKYNAPQSPNVVKSWDKALDLLPECDLKFQLIQEVKAFAEGLSEGFAKALPKAFRKGMPNQEQEQEQEQDIYRRPTKAGKAQRAKPLSPLPSDFTLTPALIEYATKKLPGVDAPALFESFTDYAKAHAKRYADWPAAFQGWVRNAIPGTQSFAAGKYPKQGDGGARWM